MNRSTHVVSMLTLAMVSLTSVAQTPSVAPAKATSGPSASATTIPSDATFDEFLKKMFGWNPDLTWKVVEIKPSEASGISEATVVFSTPQGQQMQRIYVTADQKYAFSGEIIPFGADPFAATREQLKNVNGPSHGPKDAALTIVEFGDLECPACQKAQSNINKLMAEEPKARLIFQNFPLVTIHKWALSGAKYLDCFGRQNNDAVWKFISLAYDHQSEINEQNVDQMLKGYIKDAGGDPDAVAACAAKPETEKRVRDSMVLGEKLGVNSTPTFYIDGRKLLGFGSNVPYDVVKEMVDFYIGGQGK
jgi:protein-disulfide isomerase